MLCEIASLDLQYMAEWWKGRQRDSPSFEAGINLPKFGGTKTFPKHYGEKLDFAPLGGRGGLASLQSATKVIIFIIIF